VVELTGRPIWFVDGVIGFAAYGGALFVLAATTGGMGLGDVKLAGLIGLVLGAMDLRLVAVAAMLGFLAGGVGGVVALAMGRDRKAEIPFRPYMALRRVPALLLRSRRAHWYSGPLH